MPTQTPRNGAPRRTAWVIAAIRPSRARSAAMQAAKAPTPGSTSRSAPASTCGSALTTMAWVASNPSAARMSAFSAERRLPEP